MFPPTPLTRRQALRTAACGFGSWLPYLENFHGAVEVAVAIENVFVGLGADVESEDYQETKRDLDGWPINITSYRVGDAWYCTIDNVSPGAPACVTAISIQPSLL